MQENQNINKVRVEVLAEKILKEIKELKDAMELLDDLMREAIVEIKDVKEQRSLIKCLFSSIDMLNGRRLGSNHISIPPDKIQAEVEELKKSFEAKQQSIVNLEHKESLRNNRRVQELYNRLMSLGEKYTFLIKKVRDILEKNESHDSGELKEFRESYLKTKDDLKLLENSFNEADLSLHQQLEATIKKQIGLCKDAETLIDKLISDTSQQELIQQVQREKTKQAKKQEKRKARRKANKAKNKHRFFPEIVQNVENKTEQKMVLKDEVNIRKVYRHLEEHYKPRSPGVLLAEHKRHSSWTEYELEVWNKIQSNF